MKGKKRKKESKTRNMNNQKTLARYVPPPLPLSSTHSGERLEPFTGRVGPIRGLSVGQRWIALDNVGQRR